MEIMWFLLICWAVAVATGFLVVWAYKEGWRFRALIVCRECRHDWFGHYETCKWAKQANG